MHEYTHILMIQKIIYIHFKIIVKCHLEVDVDKTCILSHKNFLYLFKWKDKNLPPQLEQVHVSVAEWEVWRTTLVRTEGLLCFLT